MSADAGVLLQETDSSGIRWLTLNRPDKRNALDDRLIAALKSGLGAAETDDAVRAVAVRGAGQDFCAGADLAALRKIREASVLENLADADALAELFLLMRQLRKSVIAVVHGRALAGGCGLATACDLVLATESAQFGYPEAKLGFVPAMVMAILRRNVGEKRAFELVTLGSTLSAREAERIGLINRVFPDARFEEETATFLTTLAQRSPSALQLCKRLLHHQDGMGFEAAVRAGADLNVLARLTEDVRSGLDAFLAKGD